MKLSRLSAQAEKSLSSIRLQGPQALFTIVGKPFADMVRFNDQSIGAESMVRCQSLCS